MLRQLIPEIPPGKSLSNVYCLRWQAKWERDEAKHALLGDLCRFRQTVMNVHGRDRRTWWRSKVTWMRHKYDFYPTHSRNLYKVLGVREADINWLILTGARRIRLDITINPRYMQNFQEVNAEYTDSLYCEICNRELKGIGPARRQEHYDTYKHKKNFLRQIVGDYNQRRDEFSKISDEFWEEIDQVLEVDLTEDDLVDSDYQGHSPVYSEGSSEEEEEKPVKAGTRRVESDPDSSSEEPVEMVSLRTKAKFGGAQTERSYAELDWLPDTERGFFMEQYGNIMAENPQKFYMALRATGEMFAKKIPLAEAWHWALDGRNAPDVEDRPVVSQQQYDSLLLDRDNVTTYGFFPHLPDAVVRELPTINPARVELNSQEVIFVKGHKALGGNDWWRAHVTEHSIQSGELNIAFQYAPTTEVQYLFKDLGGLQIKHVENPEEFFTTLEFFFTKPRPRPKAKSPPAELPKIPAELPVLEPATGSDTESEFGGRDSDTESEYGDDPNFDSMAERVKRRHQITEPVIYDESYHDKMFTHFMVKREEGWEAAPERPPPPTGNPFSEVSRTDSRKSSRKSRTFPNPTSSLKHLTRTTLSTTKRRHPVPAV